MKYTKLGNSDLNASRICMGCMGFGDSARGQHSWTIDEEHTREIIKRGLDLGVNFYDTAIAYQSGTSEQYLGRALRDFAKRDEVVVATKFLPRTPDEIEKGISGQQHIENMLNTSLSNLGMDYVDLYIYHMWDWKTPNELVKSITCDRGTEFANWRQIEEKLNCDVYFADPYCAWQKGSNENSNGLLREFYPKGRNLSRVSPKTLKKNLALINARPRKVLNFCSAQSLWESELNNCCT